MLTQDCFVPLPRHPLTACAAAQPVMPDTPDLPVEPPKTSVVRRSPIVLVMAAELGVQGFLLLGHGLVPVFFAPFGDGFQSSAEPFRLRPHMHRELPLPAAGTYMR